MITEVEVQLMMREAEELVQPVRKTWEQLKKASPEAVEASRVAWYTIPRAKASSFKESELPSGPGEHGPRVSKLASVMVDLSQSEHFAHLDLDELAEFARKRVQWEHAQHNRLLKQVNPKWVDVPTVLRLAKLTPVEEKVSNAMLHLNVLDGEKVPGAVDRLIADATGARSVNTVRVHRLNILRKLKALTQEKA